MMWFLERDSRHWKLMVDRTSLYGTMFLRLVNAINH